MLITTDFGFLRYSIVYFTNSSDKPRTETSRGIIGQCKLLILIERPCLRTNINTYKRSSTTLKTVGCPFPRSRKTPKKKQNAPSSMSQRTLCPYPGCAGEDISRIYNILVPFVPRILIDRFAHSNWNLDKKPFYFSIKGVILFLDVSGFTPMTERLSQYGAIGGEMIRNGNRTMNDSCNSFSSLSLLHGTLEDRESVRR